MDSEIAFKILHSFQWLQCQWTLKVK